MFSNDANIVGDVGEVDNELYVGTPEQELKESQIKLRHNYEKKYIMIVSQKLEKIKVNQQEPWLHGMISLEKSLQGDNVYLFYRN